MFISTSQIDQAVATLRSYGARRVLLFGSFVHDPEHARDIDLAVEGVPVSQLWRANGEVAEVLDCPYDLVAMEESPEFYALINKDARVLYG